MFNNVFANIRNKSLNRQISRDLIYKNATYSRKHVTIYHSILLFTLPCFRFNSSRSESLLGLVLTPTFPTVSATLVRKPMDRGSEAAICRECSYAALSVQPCCTVGATMLPLSVPGCYTIGIPMLDRRIPMLDYRYTYAGLTVYLCWTIGIPMLDLWYQDAILFWYRFSKVFTTA